MVHQTSEEVSLSAVYGIKIEHEGCPLVEFSTRTGLDLYIHHIRTPHEGKGIYFSVPVKDMEYINSIISKIDGLNLVGYEELKDTTILLCKVKDDALNEITDFDAEFSKVETYSILSEGINNPAECFDIFSFNANEIELLREQLEKKFSTVELMSFKRIEPADLLTRDMKTIGMNEELTDKERLILQRGLANGFFELPMDKCVGELSKITKLPESIIDNDLKNIYRKMLGGYIRNVTM